VSGNGRGQMRQQADAERWPYQLKTAAYGSIRNIRA
jgi:hypothetical protein